MAREASTTITLKKSTKSQLETLKGNKDWDTFLQELYLQKRKRSGANSLAKMRDLLGDAKDLDKVSSSSRKFRKDFKLR